ncbi:phytochelatin synthase family protein [Paraburkholderia ultramafica]|uniref:phytochelatin synthase family protein n=1 Tax=Paraburkholderia ultramafica TaxID=1544867 RepID=UPI001FEC3D62
MANAAQVAQEGMTLDQLSAALSALPVDVTKYHAGDLTLDQFRVLIRDTALRQGRFVLLNFRRVEIGETGGGHWSPLAAYDVASDSALLLDVARYKYPAVWVPLAQLYTRHKNGGGCRSSEQPHDALRVKALTAPMRASVQPAAAASPHSLRRTRPRSPPARESRC